MASIALATAVAHMDKDHDLAPLVEACRGVRLQASVLAWDDPTVSWGRFDAVLVRSPWDYTERHVEFIEWCLRVDRQSLLLNPLPVLRWNTDKHYLRDLALVGVPVIETEFVEPDADPLPALHAFLEGSGAPEFVVKPTIGAGARDTQRYRRDQEFSASNHIARLLDQERGVMLQPYLPAVDEDGETALLFFDGDFSHAIRKAPLLTAGADGSRPELQAGEPGISPRPPAADELALAERALRAAASLLQLDRPLPYARVDLLRDPAGAPRLLEMELVEPSLFFAHGPGSAERFAACLARRLNLP
jgi:O-ureido-D-serine cyclo-ligase